VTYVSPATHDAVDGSGVARCVPSAGTTFLIGTTIVICTALDAAANPATGTFNVTVGDVTRPGEMSGNGFVSNDDVRYHFNFHVKERTPDNERGSFQLRVEDHRRGFNVSRRRERNDRFVARVVTFVAFSDDPTFRPGRRPKPNVDTVVFFGQGEWNGNTGYSFRVFAMDQGEPGRHRESVEVTIWDPAGNVVGDVSGELDGGNVQSKRIRH